MPVAHGLSVPALTQLLESLLDVNVSNLNELPPDLLNSVSILFREAALSSPSSVDASASINAASEKHQLKRKLSGDAKSVRSLPATLRPKEATRSSSGFPDESSSANAVKSLALDASESTIATTNKEVQDSVKWSQDKPKQQATQPNQEQNPVKEITSEEELNTEMEACKKENKMLIMDFYSYSCKPCVKAMPRYVSFAKQNPEISWVKLNIDVIGKELRYKWDVKKIPRFVSWKDGNVIAECGTGTPTFTSSLALDHFVDFALKKNAEEETTFAIDMDF
jgi:thiol-disulfide isomerase/thioredoxin